MTVDVALLEAALADGTTEGLERVARVMDRGVVIPTVQPGYLGVAFHVRHIFHLHTHQWQFQPNNKNSNYLDSQIIGPGSGYTYEIAFGGF